MGLRVDIANNGREGFDMRRRNRYDLVFMDIQMPVMNGIEATHAILDYERDEEVQHVPIVALTANALKGDRERFLGEGMDEYISKPIEMSELIYILNKFLHTKSRTEIEAPRELPTKGSRGGRGKSRGTKQKEQEISKEIDGTSSKKILIAEGIYHSVGNFWQNCWIHSI